MRHAHHRKENDKINEIKEYTKKVFEDIKHIDENGNEYWYARELQNILEYHQWRSIHDLIERAKIACKESQYNINDHFAFYRKMVDIGSNTKRKVLDYKLSRYACYLIVMNGNPKKEILTRYNLSNIDVLKVGHHGSKTSSSKDFINEINPKYSIISVGKNNRYGHPNKEVLDILSESKIYRTDEDGSIMFKIKNNKLEVETCVHSCKMF